MRTKMNLKNESIKRKLLLLSSLPPVGDRVGKLLLIVYMFLIQYNIKEFLLFEKKLR